MDNQLNLYNIIGYATFKYKYKPNPKSIHLIKKLYENISIGPNEKNITIFDKDGDSNMLIIKNKHLYSIKSDKLKTKDIEEILGYILSYISKTANMYIIIREKDIKNNCSIIYGFSICDYNIFSIPAKTLENLNNNARFLTGFSPETNIQFIDT